MGCDAERIEDVKEYNKFKNSHGWFSQMKVIILNPTNVMFKNELQIFYLIISPSILHNGLNKDCWNTEKENN